MSHPYTTLYIPRVNFIMSLKLWEAETNLSNAEVPPSQNRHHPFSTSFQLICLLKMIYCMHAQHFRTAWWSLYLRPHLYLWQASFQWILLSKRPQYRSCSRWNDGMQECRGDELQIQKQDRSSGKQSYRERMLFVVCEQIIWSFL